ncbi:MAG: hypothetical protein WBD02_04820 [Acidimicrobiia bacterium]
MKIRQMTVLLVALVGLSACPLPQPVDLGYTITPGTTGAQRSITFYVPDNPVLAFRVAVVLNDINRNTFMSHSMVQSAYPGVGIGVALVTEVSDADPTCGRPVYGCAFPQTDGGFASGGAVFVEPSADSDSANFLVAHEIGHILGLAHHDSVIRDSSGLMTKQTMCSGENPIPGSCGAADMVIAFNSDFYAEGDLRGLQYLSSHGR